MKRLLILCTLVFATVVCVAQDADPPAAGADLYQQPLPPADSPEPAADALKKELETYEKGQPKREFTYYLDDLGRKIKHGVYIEFYEDGDRRREAEYTHGRINGQDRWYHPNGNIWMEIRYTLGVRDGMFREFNVNGRVKRLVRYKNGRVLRSN